MRNKDKIINLIWKTSCWITAKNIFENLENIDKTTVYRNLEKLSKSGDILEEFSKTWEKVYSLQDNHHHHFVCDICAETTNIGCFFDEGIKNLENDFWFIVKNHSFVLSWVCKKCNK